MSTTPPPPPPPSSPPPPPSSGGVPAGIPPELTKPHALIGFALVLLSFIFSFTAWRTASIAGFSSSQSGTGWGPGWLTLLVSLAAGVLLFSLLTGKIPQIANPLYFLVAGAVLTVWSFIYMLYHGDLDGAEGFGVSVKPGFGVILDFILGLLITALGYLYLQKAKGKKSILPQIGL